MQVNEGMVDWFNYMELRLLFVQTEAMNHTLPSYHTKNEFPVLISWVCYLP